jgi:hypothetical protein
MKRLLFALVATVVLVGAPSGVFAQSGSPGPYQGIFSGGGNNTDPNIHHRLDLSFSVAAAYDDDVLPALTGGIEPTTRPFNGYNTTYTGNAQYQWQGRRMQAGLTATSALRQFTDTNDYTMTHALGAGFSAQFARRTTLFVNQSANYSPPYLFGLFPNVDVASPGAVIAGGPNYLVDDTESLSYETIVTVEHGLTRRGTVSVSGDYRFTDFRDNSRGRPDVRSSGVRTRYGYSFGRNTAFTAGYHYRSGELGFGSTAFSSEQGVEVGMAYNRKLSATRKATLSFSIGSTTMDLPSVPAAGIVAGRQSDVSAEAALNYQFARSWIVRGAYRRGAEFVAELSEPIFVDGVTLTLGGDMGRRIHLSSSGAYSSGQGLQPGATTNLLKTYTGNLRLAVDLTRSLGSYAEYLYYLYDFSGNPNLAPGLLTKVERNGVRAGLTVWFSMRRH